MNHPPSGTYYIFSRELGCYASVRHGENVLRGAPLDPDQYNQKWILNIDHNESGDDHVHCSCTFTMANQGDRSLNVNSVSDNQPVYSLASGKSWSLGETEDSTFKIFLISDDGNYYNWYIGNDGDPIVITKDNGQPQGWQFELPA